MIECGDTTLPAVVRSEPSEAVKEWKKKRCAQNVVFNNVGPITWQHHTMCWRRLSWEGVQSPQPWPSNYEIRWNIEIYNDPLSGWLKRPAGDLYNYKYNSTIVCGWKLVKCWDRARHLLQVTSSKSGYCWSESTTGNYGWVSESSW